MYRDKMIAYRALNCRMFRNFTLVMYLMFLKEINERVTNYSMILCLYLVYGVVFRPIRRKQKGIIKVAHAHYYCLCDFIMHTIAHLKSLGTWLDEH